MNNSETIKLFAIINSLYPRSESFAQADRTMVMTWAAMLSDVPFQMAEAAVQAIAATQPYAPSISEIRAKIAPKSIGADEAWGYITNAIKRHGIYNAAAAKKSMPAEVWDMVTRIGWENICMSEEPAVERGLFIKLWAIQEKRIAEQARIPAEIRKLLENAQIKRLEA